MALALLANLNGYVRVQLSKPSRPRTTGIGSQNHHINGHVQQIAVETGNDFDMVKMAAKQAALGMGYPFKTIAGQVVPYSETELDTEQAAVLIEALHVIAAELDIRLKEDYYEVL
jgi:hypothetical protein